LADDNQEEDYEDGDEKYDDYDEEPDVYDDQKNFNNNVNSNSRLQRGYNTDNVV